MHVCVVMPDFIGGSCDSISGIGQRAFTPDILDSVVG
jgi:hypothetical protein